MKKIITLSLIIFGLLNLSFAVEKTEINLKVFVPKTGINIGTHYIPEPKEGETPMEVFALGSFPKTDKVTWTGADEFFDVTVKDEKLQEGWSKVQIIPKKAGFGNLSLQVDQKDSDGKELPPLIFTEKIFVYKVEIKNGDGSALENQIFIGKDQERSFKAVLSPAEIVTDAGSSKLSWEWSELNNKTLEIAPFYVNPVSVKGIAGSPAVDETKLQCKLTVNDTLKSEYLFSQKLTVVVPKIEADIIDTPPPKCTYASGVNPKSLELFINKKKISKTITITDISNGIHILYEAIYSDLNIPGTNTVELIVKDNANAGADEGIDKNIGGNETDPSPYKWDFII